MKQFIELTAHGKKVSIKTEFIYGFVDFESGCRILLQNKESILVSEPYDQVKNVLEPTPKGVRKVSLPGK